jgi:AraC family transcriptional regulator
LAVIRTLIENALFRVIDSRCDHPRSGRGPSQGGHAPHLTLVRRGCFSARIGSRSVFADVATAIMYDDGADYCISHPGEAGDDCTLITPDPALMDEVFGAPRGAHGKTEIPLSIAEQMQHAKMYRALQNATEDLITLEERVLGQLCSLRQCEAKSMVDRRPASRAARRARIVRIVKQRVAADLDRNLSLPVLASEAACSPYHLMRLFRNETGRTLRDHRLVLRVMSVLHQLTPEVDLRELAARLGFASHSHMTDSVRRLTGRTPDAMRRELRS